MHTDLRALRRGNMLALGTETGVAIITADGWHEVPEPLATLVRHAIEDEKPER